MPNTYQMNRSSTTSIPCVIVLVFLLTSCTSVEPPSRAHEIVKEVNLEKWECNASPENGLWICAPDDPANESTSIKVITKHEQENRNTEVAEDEPTVEVEDEPTVEVIESTRSVEATPTPTTVQKPRETYAWLMLDVEENLSFVRSLPVDYYIIQVAAFTSREHALKFQQLYPSYEFRSVQVKNQSGTFHVILLDAYPTRSKAAQEVTSISTTFNNPRPWIRPVNSLIQSLVR